MRTQKEKLTRFGIFGLPPVFFGYMLWFAAFGNLIPRDSLAWISLAVCELGAYVFVRLALTVLYWIVDHVNPVPH